MKPKPLPIVVLISGNGSNLQAMINAATCGLPIDIRAVISNKPNAFGLERAKRAHIPAQVISSSDFASRQDFEATLMKVIDSHQPKLVVLAGFMRKLTAKFVNHYAGRMLNIHPSLLPKYPGLKTHERVLEAGERNHGVSVHYVTEEVDGGPIICQASLTVRTEDTVASLSQRIHALEYVIYPQVLAWAATDRLILRQHQVFLDNQPVPKTGVQLDIGQARRS